MNIVCNYIPKRYLGHQSLNVGGKYLLVEIDDKHYRVVNEDGEPILYPKKWFEPLSVIPSEWKMDEYEDGEYFIYPPEFSIHCFFEKWFDKVPEVLTIFDNYVKQVQRDESV